MKFAFVSIFFDGRILDVHVCKEGSVSVVMLSIIFCKFLLWKFSGLKIK